MEKFLLPPLRAIGSTSSMLLELYYEFIYSSWVLFLIWLLLVFSFFGFFVLNVAIYALSDIHNLYEYPDHYYQNNGGTKLFLLPFLTILLF